MDAEKIIDEIFQGKCYQIESMRLVGVGEKVRCSVHGRGVAMIPRSLAADFVRAAVAAKKIHLPPSLIVRQSVKFSPESVNFSGGVPAIFWRMWKFS